MTKETPLQETLLVMTLENFRLDFVPSGGAVLEIPCNQLFRDEYQPRKTFRVKPIEELASSIKSQGLQQYPVVWFWKEEDGKKLFKIKAGERRWRAHLYLELPTMMCIVLPEPYLQIQDIDRILAQAAENSSREAHTVAEIVDVTRFTVAEIMVKKINKSGTSHGALEVGLGKVDQAFGKKSGWARQYFTLTKLHPDLLVLLDEEDEKKKINLNVGVALARAPLDAQLGIYEKSLPYFKRSHSAGYAFIVQTVRGVRVERGERIKGRKAEDKKQFIKFSSRLLDMAERFGGSRGALDREAWIKEKISSLSVEEAEKMLSNLLEATKLLETLRTELQQKRDREYRKRGATRLEAVWRRTGTENN